MAIKAKWPVAALEDGMLRVIGHGCAPKSAHILKPPWEVGIDSLKMQGWVQALPVLATKRRAGVKFPR